MINRSFLKWMFQGWYQDVSTWAFLAIMVGVASRFAAPEAEWPVWVMIAGGTVMLGDLVWAYIKFSRSMYDLEQTELWQRLKSGDKRGDS